AVAEFIRVSLHGQEWHRNKLRRLSPILRRASRAADAGRPAGFVYAKMEIRRRRRLSVYLYPFVSHGSIREQLTPPGRPETRHASGTRPTQSSNYPYDADRSPGAEDVRPARRSAIPHVGPEVLTVP